MKSIVLPVLVVAAALRFWALDAGIPYNISVDEPQVLNRALGMMRSGDFNPHFYDYPGLYIYAQLIVACVRFVAGALQGYWTSLAEPQLADFLLWGRALTALIGTATVALVYRIGVRWGPRHGLLAAGLMAVMPLHVRESHFVLTDVPVTFFVAAAFLLAIRATERPTLARFALAGAAAGLAAGTKYPGALALVMPLTAVFMADLKHSRSIVSLAVIGGAGGAFFVVAPYTLLDLPGFLNGYATLTLSYARPSAEEPGWQTYLKHLRRNSGWPMFIAIASGCVLAAVRGVRGPWRSLWLIALGFPLLYLWFISRQALIYGRYLMPLLPSVCILASAAVVSIAGTLRRQSMPRWVGNTAVAALTVIVLVPPIIQAVTFNVVHSRRGTPALAHDWLASNVARGTAVVWEGTDLSLAHTAFRAQHVHQLRHRPYEYFLENGIQYVIATSQRYGAPLADPARDPQAYAYYTQLFTRAQEVARFTPTSAHPGPEIRILRIR